MTTFDAVDATDIATPKARPKAIPADCPTNAVMIDEGTITMIRSSAATLVVPGSGRANIKLRPPAVGVWPCGLLVR